MRTSNLKILLIDDDEDAYVITRNLLAQIQEWQAHLDWVSTYEQGLATIARQEHDIYLIDYRLNNHDGLELLRKAIKQGCRAPLIILTGLQDHEIDIEAMDAGAADYLVKDQLDAAHLERCIRYSLERQRLNAQLQDKAQRLRSLAHQLSQAEQAERSRIARLLHDHLQQIVASIKFQVGRMSSEQLPEQRRQVQALLDQVMDVSRTLTVELSPPVLMDMGLSAGLNWLTNWMRQKHNLHVTSEIDSDAEPGAEPTRLMLFHAVRELLLNVVRHAQVNEASLVMKRSDDQLCITVSDSGVGFDPRTLEKPADTANTFGLAHMRERIRLLGGDMHIESGPGRGTRITLVAPRHAEQPATVAAPFQADEAADDRADGRNGSSQTPQDRPPRRIRVLLVDDHPVIREGLRRTLEDVGDMEVVGEAGDGEEAIELAHELRPDVVVMDIVMPRVNGFEATQRITRELTGVQVIGLSMYGTGDMAEAMSKAGAVAYVGKDEPVETLLAHIRKSTSPAA